MAAYMPIMPDWGSANSGLIIGKRPFTNSHSKCSKSNLSASHDPLQNSLASVVATQEATDEDSAGYAILP